MTEQIPLYSASGRRVGNVTQHHLDKMLQCGLIVRIVRASKDNKIKRVIRRSLAGEGTVHTLSALSGTKYSFEEQFDSGCRAWSLMSLSDLKHQGIYREPVHAA